MLVFFAGELRKVGFVMLVIATHLPDCGLEQMASQIENLEQDQELLDLMAGLGATNGDCPYLEGKEARWFFLEGSLVGRRYRHLMDQGYRRHGSLLYRMECSACQECQVIRIPVKDFRPSQSQKRVWRRGQAHGFSTRFARPDSSPEKLQMYRNYLRYQHGRQESLDDSGYEDFFVNSFLDGTQELQLFHGERLIGTGIIDVFEDAMSSVYFYFDPDYSEYSPGTFSMLAELEYASNLGLTWHYAGFYIAGCRQMNYKARFGPNQIKRAKAEWP